MLDLQPIFSRIVLPPVSIERAEKGLENKANAKHTNLPKFDEDQLFIAG